MRTQRSTIVYRRTLEVLETKLDALRRSRPVAVDELYRAYCPTFCPCCSIIFDSNVIITLLKYIVYDGHGKPSIPRQTASFDVFTDADLCHGI